MPTPDMAETPGIPEGLSTPLPNTDDLHDVDAPAILTRRTPREMDLLILRAMADLNWWPRIEARLVESPDGCILWTGQTKSGGYGTVRLPAVLGIRNAAGRPPNVLVHRATLVRHLGRPLGDGMTGSHRCHDGAYAAGLCVATDADPCAHRACANVAGGHVIEEASRDNLLSGGGAAAINAAKVSCFRCGGPLTPRASRSWRKCNPCSLAAGRDRGSARGVAHKGLGITQREYVALFGYSRATAETILAALADGRDPASIVRGAQIALEAAEREGVLAWLEGLRADLGGGAA